jgi:hypothetical protein
VYEQGNLIVSQAKKLLVTLITAVVAMTGLTTVASSPAFASSVSQMRLYDAPNRCLDVRDVSYDNGAPLQIYDCLPSQFNQQFYFFYVPGSGTPGRYQIVARHSGKCLDVRDASQYPGAVVQQWDCLGYGQTNQLWQRVDNGSQYSRFYAYHSGQWLRSFGLTNSSNVGQDTASVLWFQNQLF